MRIIPPGCCNAQERHIYADIPQDFISPVKRKAESIAKDHIQCHDHCHGHHEDAGNTAGDRYIIDKIKDPFHVFTSLRKEPAENRPIQLFRRLLLRLTP